MKNKIKTLCKNLGRVIALGALALGLDMTVPAQSAVSLPFINGFFLTIPAQSTNGTAIGSSYFTNSAWGNNNAFTTNFVYASKFVVTNVPVSFTNAANGLITSGYLSTNQAVYVTNGNAFSDVSFWYNQDGSIPLVNLSVIQQGVDAVQSTNYLVYTLQTFANGQTVTGPGIGAYVDTALPQNSWSFACTNSGLTIEAVSTNLPTGFLQGAHRLRLTISSPFYSGSSGSNTIVYAVLLNGYRPPSIQ